MKYQSDYKERVFVMRKLVAIILAVSVVVSFSGCGKKEKTVAPEVKSTAVNVTVVKAENKKIEDSVTYTGEIKASEQTSVSAKVGGAAVTVYKKVGDYVKTGDILIKIDETDYSTKYEQAVASKKQAEAAYQQAIAGKEQAVAGR